MKKSVGRKELLIKDLLEYDPKDWRLNLPFRNYTLRFEDIIPALSGVIGKISLVAAFAVAWTQGLGITDPSFAVENVRLEIIIASIFAIICAFILPHSSPPGTLAPLIPIVPALVVLGIHPLPLGILIGVTGIIISIMGYYGKIMAINGEGTKGGLMLLFGYLGVRSSLDNLRNWTGLYNNQMLFVSLIITGVLIYILLGIFRARWLVIPICVVGSLTVSALFGIYPTFNTHVALPVINPSLWWNHKWGTGWGINLDNFIKAIPYAILVHIMWATDALAMKSIQEAHYPEKAKKAVFKTDITFFVVSVRNIVGVILGGTQTAAVWRSFIIPLGTVVRPIAGSALLLGITGVIFGIWGLPLDIAVFPPLIWLVLLFGVFIPLLETGLNRLKTAIHTQTAVLCFIAGLALSPAIGWITGIFIENFKVLNDASDKAEKLPGEIRITTGIVIVITLAAYAFTYI